MNFKKLKMIFFSIILAGGITYTIDSSAYAWNSIQSPTIMDTHKLIAQQGVNILIKDLSAKDKIKLNSNLEKLKANLSSLKKGSVAPDSGIVGIDRDYALFQDHFYDPDTGKNFTYNLGSPFAHVDDTAESQIRNYIGQAISLWKSGKYDKATHTLGVSIHYFSDLNEPHHASNLIGGPRTAHTKFEEFAEGIKDKLKVTSMGYDTSKGEYATSDKYKYISDFITAQSNKYSKIAKKLSPRAALTSSTKDWNYVAKETMKNSQQGTASLIYRFLKEVSSNDSRPEITVPIGKFHVAIKTSNENEAGTNDHVYFGMQLNDGRVFEKECTYVGGYFGQNFKKAYEFNVDDSSFKPKDITKVWLRKKKNTDDDWKVEGIEIYMKCKKVFDKRIDKWLKGDITYTMEVEGL